MQLKLPFASIALAGALFAQAEAPVQDTAETEAPAGIIRLSGVGQNDRVQLDHEEINADGLKRAGYQFYVAAGEYTLRITNRDTGKSCSTRVEVRPAEQVTPSCDRPSRARMAD